MAPENKETNTATSARLKGRIENYLLDESIEEYLERVDFYFALNKIEDSKEKVLMLITQVGTAAAQKIQRAFKPNKVDVQSYEQVTATCKKLFQEESKPLVERHKLHQRNQKESETLTDFALALQVIGEKCKFSDDDSLDNALRDQVVAGVRNIKTKRELLMMDEKSSFAAVVEKAKTVEMTYRVAEEMKIEEEPRVNRVFNNFRKQQQPDVKSWRNRDEGRENKSQVTCFKCGAKGHYAYKCGNSRSRSTKSQPQGQWRQRKDGRVDSLGDQLNQLRFEDDSEDNMVEMSSVVGKLSPGPEFVSLRIEKVLLRMEIDTGSCDSVCSFADYKKYFAKKKLIKPDKNLLVISGDSLHIKGKFEVCVRRQERIMILPIYVIDTRKKFEPLIGRRWLDDVFPGWRKVFQVNAIKVSEPAIANFRTESVKKIKSDYAKLFDNDLTMPIKDFVVDIRMKAEARPFVHKGYTVPFNVRERVCEQLSEMERLDIIEKN